MSNNLPPESAISRLTSERNIWMATVRPDGRPHLVPIWFAWHEAQIYLCMQSNSVKAHNLAQNNQIALSLEDGSNVVICEGSAATVEQPWPDAVQAIFKAKYDWTLATDHEYGLMLVVTPLKWLQWGPGS